jgi:exonuclease SbcC
MKLTRLVTSNTKGQDLDDELSGRDLFVGPNGTGKSTRLEATIGGILGHIPSKGKTLSDFFSIASDSVMDVTLKTDTDFSCTRTITEKAKRKKGTSEKTFSLSNSISVFPPKGESKDAEFKERIKAEFGDFAVMLDLDEFLEMSDERKRAFIFSLTNPEDFGWNRDRVSDELAKNLSNEGLASTLMKIWDDSKSIQDNIAIMLKWAKEELSGLKKQLKAAQATKATLLKQKQEVGSLPSSLPQIEEELQKAREELNTVSAQIAAQKEKVKRFKTLKEIASSLELKLDQPIPPAANAKEVATLEERLKQTKENAEMLSERRQKLQDNIGQMREKYTEASKKLKDEAVKQKILDQQVTTLRSSEKCPLLGETCPSQDRLQERTVELTEKLLDADKAVQDAEKEVKRLDKEGHAEQEAVQRCMSDTEALSKLIVSLTNELAQMKQVNKEAEAVQANQAEAQKQLDKIKSELSELDIQDIEPLNVAEAGVRERIKELEAKRKQQQEVNDLLKSFDKAKLQEMELEEKVESFEDACIFLGPSQLQGDMLKQTIAPLTSKINELLQKTSDQYNLDVELVDKNGKEIFNMCWHKDDKVIPFESLSGGEKVIFSTALLCALVLLKNPPLKVICIEASEVDAQNLTTLLQAINDFGNEIDNFLMATHVKPTEPAGWSMHILGAA